jgi:OTU domain-containing protein 3
VEDDQGFATYAGRMRREGVWAGHMELQAASLLLEANICIHQVRAGRLWACLPHVAGLHSVHHHLHSLYPRLHHQLYEPPADSWMLAAHTKGLCIPRACRAMLHNC